MNLIQLLKRTQLLLALIMLTGLNSCLPEMKIAKSFTNSTQDFTLLVNSPDLVYKYSRKGETIEGFDSLTEAAQDSALWFSSKYVQFLSDSLFLESYMNSFIEELRLLGFKVYLQSSTDSFPTAGPQSYYLDLAQIQVDEYLYPIEDTEEFFGSVYYKKLSLNAVDISCWFDLSKSGITPRRTTTLYHSGTSTDDFSGKFFLDPFSGDVRYRMSIDTLMVNDIYRMVSTLGTRHAGYLYDYFLNQYIARHLPENAEMIDYFHYNRKRQIIEYSFEDKFTVLGHREKK